MGYSSFIPRDRAKVGAYGELQIMLDVARSKHGSIALASTEYDRNTYRRLVRHYGEENVLRLNGHVDVVLDASQGQLEDIANALYKVARKPIGVVINPPEEFYKAQFEARKALIQSKKHDGPFYIH